MRTTLNIDDDVLLAAKNLARHENKTAGQIISRLARTGLASDTTPAAPQPRAVCGFRPFPKEERIVSNDLINKLREAGEY